MTSGRFCSYSSFLAGLFDYEQALNMFLSSPLVLVVTLAVNVQSVPAVGVAHAISTRWRRDQGGQGHVEGANLLLVEEFELWWTPQKLPQAGLAQSSVTLSQRFFEQLVEAPVPLDLRILATLRLMIASPGPSSPLLSQPNDFSGPREHCLGVLVFLK
jgi:hypothetical protein